MKIIDTTIELGVKELKKHGVLLTRDQWLKEVKRCESEGIPVVCEAIVKATAAMEIEDEDTLDTWVGDAESVEGNSMVGTARAILAYAHKCYLIGRVYGDGRRIWRKDMVRGMCSVFRSSFLFTD